MVSECGEGLPVHVLGADLTIKISSRDTNGAFAVFEGHTPPLEGPPLHRHNDHDECWFIARGEYRFEVDGREIYASAGATVFARAAAATRSRISGQSQAGRSPRLCPAVSICSLKKWRPPAPVGRGPTWPNSFPCFRNTDRN
jgi:hypothetical protein